MKVLAPLRIHRPSRRVAVVRKPAASDPEPGSVRAQAPSFSPVAKEGG